MVALWALVRLPVTSSDVFELACFYCLQALWKIKATCTSLPLTIPAFYSNVILKMSSLNDVSPRGTLFMPALHKHIKSFHRYCLGLHSFVSCLLVWRFLTVLLLAIEPKAIYLFIWRAVQLNSVRFNPKQMCVVIQMLLCYICDRMMRWGGWESLSFEDR